MVPILLPSRHGGEICTSSAQDGGGLDAAAVRVASAGLCGATSARPDRSPGRADHPAVAGHKKNGRCPRHRPLRSACV